MVNGECGASFIELDVWMRERIHSDAVRALEKEGNLRMRARISREV